MAGGRSSGSGSSRGRPDNDPLRRLAQLGEGGVPASSEKSPANEDRLRNLGDRIDGAGRSSRRTRSNGSSAPKHRRSRPRWSRKRKVLTTLCAIVVLLGAAVGSGYFYLRYEWGKVKKINCTSCAVATTAIAPFNVLIIGSDTRVGNTGQAAKSFGTTQDAGGQRSDTIKILHVDPKTGTADLLSIPRDTWVEMSGLPESSGLTGPEKINTAYNDGPVPLVDTIQNTFGIPINHFVVVDFNGLISAVQSVGGISMNVPFPLRDCSEDGCYIDNSGLDITTTGCQVLNGTQVLSLARSRYFEYDDPAEGGWNGDPTGDLGRITRQNEIIEALISKIESTYDPLTLRAFLDSVVHDIAVDTQLGPGLLFDLANRYHAFSPSKLVTYTLPTTSAQNFGGDVQIVEEPEAQQMLTQFLGTAPDTPTTPPLDVNSDPLSVPTGSAVTAPTSNSGTSVTSPTPTTTTTTLPPFDPTPC